MKDYIDFLKVSSNEIKDVYQLARDYTVETANHDVIYEAVTNLDLLTLIKLALQDAKVDLLCKLPIFDSYWKDIWRQCGRNPQEEAHTNKLTIHEYQCQATINTFDFIKSIAIYQEYLTIIESGINNAEMKALPYLVAALNLNYYPALVTATQQLIDLNRINKDVTFAFQAIEIAKRAAEKYWAAGYLLLGTTYIHLAEKKNPFYIMEGFKALLAAKKLEPYSQDMLNNAFQGQSLSVVTYGEINDWDDILNYFAKAQNSLKIGEMNQIYKAANETVDTIRKKWLVPQEAPSIGLKF